MKGLLFIFIIYSVVLAFCLFIKYFIMLVKKNKKSGNNTTQKIYYIENSSPKKRKPPKVNPKIALKGTIIEKDEFEN